MAKGTRSCVSPLRRLSLQTVALALSLLLLMGSTVTGTMAWMMLKTDLVANTFTIGNISITLDEARADENGQIPDVNDRIPAADQPTAQNVYPLRAGASYTKDPRVTVKQGSDNSWLFVQIEQSANYSTFMELYAVADGWTELDAAQYPGIYYRHVNAADLQTADAQFDVLAGNVIRLKTGFTQQDVDALTQQTDYPRLTVTAYAIQRDLAADTTAPAAWQQILAERTAALRATENTAP